MSTRRSRTLRAKTTSWHHVVSMKEAVLPLAVLGIGLSLIALFFRQFVNVETLASSNLSSMPAMRDARVFSSAVAAAATAYFVKDFGKAGDTAAAQALVPFFLRALKRT